MYKLIIFRVIIILSLPILISCNLSCSTTGLVKERFTPDYYKIPKLLPENISEKNPKIIVIGDIQAGWRLNERFLKPKNWNTWKMLIIPFYEIYWLSNGFIGAFDGIRRSTTYGKDSRLMVRDAVYIETKRSDIDFILCLGDIAANDGRRTDHWKMFLDEYKHNSPIIDEIPFVPVIGNHDYANDPKYGWENYSSIFDYPRFYTIGFKDAELFVVDSDFILDQKCFIDNDEQDSLFEQWFVSSENISEQSWLEQKLAASKKSFKIVAMHHPPFSFGKHSKDWYNSSYGNDLVEKRKTLINIFKKYNVDVVLSGHDHLYQHNDLTYQDDSGIDRTIHFVISSGGGVPLRNLSSKKKNDEILSGLRKEGYEIGSTLQKSVFHYTIIDISSDLMSVQTYEVNSEKNPQIELFDEILVNP